MSFDFEKQYSEEWRKLGFYYQFDNENSCWRIFGSRDGLVNLCDLLLDYVKSNRHTGISDHEHYGPDSYLKVVTWHFPIINHDGIYGSPEDILKLEGLIRRKIFFASIDEEMHIDRDYSDKNECYLLIKLMGDGFDPATFSKTA